MRQRSVATAALLALLVTFPGVHGINAQNAGPPIKALPPTKVLPRPAPAPSTAPAVVIDAPSALSGLDKLKIVAAGSPKGALAPIGVDTWQELTPGRPNITGQAWLEINGRVFWNARESQVDFAPNVVQDNYVQVSFNPTPRSRYIVTFYLSILSDTRPPDAYSFVLYGGNGRETIEVRRGGNPRKAISTILQAGPSTATIGAMLTSYVPDQREAPWQLHSVEISQVR